jgi:hypothetical protein
MRDIYEKKLSMIDMQQGVIINGCVAEDYPNLEVFGVIITPRCDIENNKVSTIHYLPIVSLEDWLSNDYVKRYQKDANKKNLSKMQKILSNHKISTTILEGKLCKKDILKAAEVLPQKEKKQFETDLEEFFCMKDFAYCRNNVHTWTDGKKLLNDICKWKNASYYIIEDWNDEKKYMIIWWCSTKYAF